MNLQKYKDREIQKIIDQAFVQFNINSADERLEITEAIKTQLNSSKPLSSFSPSNKASSSKYRMDVRNALIDIIAQLLTVRDMHNSLTKIEAESKDLITSVSGKLTSLENVFYKNASIIKESFQEGMHSGTHFGTAIKNGKLIADRALVEAKTRGITIQTHPAESDEEIIVQTKGNPLALAETGLLSDSYHVNMRTHTKPAMYIAGGYLAGMVISVSIETLEEIIPSVISAKAGSAFKIQAVYAGAINNEGDIEYSDNLGIDLSLGDYSFVSTNTQNSYKYFKVFLYFPEYNIDDKKMLHYAANIYNVRLFSLPEYINALGEDNTASVAGTFVSNTYKSNFPIIGVRWNIQSNEEPTVNISFAENSDPGAPTAFTIPSNEKLIENNVIRIDHYSEENPYVFPLTRVPFMQHGSTNFIFKIEGADQNTIEIPIFDLSKPDTSGIVFDKSIKQFYYKDKYLYTNFPLTSDMTVEYAYTCDGVILTAELEGIQSIDGYTIELITLDDGFSYKE